MAPRKSAATAKSRKKKPAPDVNKAVKRPARGYHKFKSGLLNVTPKGGEIEMVKSNQDSPLLRLPPEIRNRIWEYTLGNNLLRASVRYSGRDDIWTWTSPPHEPNIGIALLRSCRQIYSETALMPLRLNTFEIEEFWRVRKALKVLRKYQRKEITTFRIVIPNPPGAFLLTGTKDILQGLLPALEGVEVLVFHASDATVGATFRAIEAVIHREFPAGPRETVAVTVKWLNHAMSNRFDDHVGGDVLH